MKTVVVFIITLLTFSVASGQSFYSNLIDTSVIINVGKADTPFIRVYAKFFVNEKGEIGDISIKKIECSKCDDSLVNNAKNQSIEFVKEQQYKPVLQEGKFIGVYYTLPVLFKLQDAKP